MFSLKDINKAALESFDLLPDDAYLRISVLLCLYGYSRATLYRNIKKGLALAYRATRGNLLWHRNRSSSYSLSSTLETTNSPLPADTNGTQDSR